MGFWDSLGTGEFSNVEGSSRSVAVDVVTKFGLPLEGYAGGALTGVDIKHLDALTAIRLSLLEELALSGNYYDIFVTNNGRVTFREVGRGNGVSDVYYTIQTSDYITQKSGVLVTGGKPLPRRYMGAWTNILTGAERIDATALVSDCMRPNFSKYFVILYNDPQLNSQYADGIDNVVAEIDSPYTRLIGYAQNIDPGNISDDVTINFSKQASIPILIAEESVGELFKPPVNYDTNTSCFATGIEVEGGLPVPLPPGLVFDSIRGVTYNKFMGVSSVFIIGTELDMCRGVPRDAAAALSGNSTPENTDLWVSINTPEQRIFRLNEGIHYVVNYDNGVPSIKFADRSDPFLNPKVGDNSSAFVTSTCLFGKTTTQITGCILPTTANTGILVNQVFAVVDVDSPCVTILDPNGKAADVANQIVYELAPMFIEEQPAPIAYNGTLIDLSDGYADHDPTTVQSFTDTEYEQVLADMDGGAGMSVSLSSLSASDTARLSYELAKLFTSDRGVSTTYICGPECNPDVGAYGPGGGVINEVVYSYSDGGSYTVSVTEGSMLVGEFPSITSGVHVKMTEDVSARGIVLQDAGNNVMFKVLLEGIGVREAINTCPSVIRVGDSVTVSIHNNPVEG